MLARIPSLGYYAPFTLFFFSSYVPRLSLGAPDVLDKTVTLGQAVHGVVGLAHGADEAAEGVDVVLAGDGTAVLVNLGNGDLDRAVILGLDDAVGSAALAGDVAVIRSRNISTLLYKIFRQSFWCFELGDLVFLSRGFGAVLQIDDLATVVLHLDGVVWLIWCVKVVVMHWWDRLANS